MVFGLCIELIFYCIIYIENVTMLKTDAHKKHISTTIMMRYK